MINKLRSSYKTQGIITLALDPIISHMNLNSSPIYLGSILILFLRLPLNCTY
jgi:hypothetical protein